MKIQKSRSAGRACATSMLGMMTAIALSGQTFTSLYSFDITNGNPSAQLVQGLDGNLYGPGPGAGAGTIFKITPGGTFATFYTFCSQPQCADGGIPSGALAVGTSGDFYGTTIGGGIICNTAANGCGTVFKIAPGGKFTSLYDFCPTLNCFNTSSPEPNGLIQASNGDFYGTTYLGGNLYEGGRGYGTVFKMTPAGFVIFLYDFCPQVPPTCVDGANPSGALVQATNGDLYGTTAYGGATGFGTVFKISPGGTFTTLHSFCSQPNCADGAYPNGGLVQGADGYLYGTTNSSGNISSDGKVFKMSPSGKLTTLYTFCTQSGCPDGAGPLAGLIQGSDGRFYGTTSVGGGGCGAEGCGTIFAITPHGSLTTLISFGTFCVQSGCGLFPGAALVQATNGDFFGTTYDGGTNSYGTIFSLSIGLGPFVETLPASGKVGTAVKILGTNLTGATSVTFNGTVAVFTVKSASEIRVTVPTGATTGTVQVVTPSGTLSSNLPFRVP